MIIDSSIIAFSYAVQNYFQADGLGIPNVGDNLYSDTLDTNIEYNLETGEYIDSYTTIGKIAFGECNEASIMSVLFDLLDGTSESYDNLQYSHSVLWDSVFNNLNVTTFSEFESNFSAGSKLKEIYFGQLLEEFGFSSTNLVQSTAAIKTPPTLSWRVHQTQIINLKLLYINHQIMKYSLKQNFLGIQQ